MDLLFRIVGWGVAIWIVIWVLYHPDQVHQIATNIGSLFSSAKG